MNFSVAIGFMTNDVDDVDNDNSAEQRKIRIERRNLRCKYNIFELPEISFKKSFRLSKEAFKYILVAVENDLVGKTQSSIPPVVKLQTVLRFLAEGGYQHGVGQDIHANMSQRTVSKVLSEVLNSMEKRLCPKWIKFDMTEEEKNAAKKHFFEKTGIPNIIGCIDGTHVQIVRPSEDEHIFFNRKLTHSVNTMMICDHEMRIRSVNATYGGSSHDAMIWSLSKERSFLERKWESGETFWILGDSAYPLEPWLMTPFRNVADGSREARYNYCHSKARSLIERTFGVLKARFRCLLKARELHYHPQKVAQIINACSMLHNVCLHFKVSLNDDETEENDDENDYEEHVEHTVADRNIEIARRIRESIKNNIV